MEYVQLTLNDWVEMKQKLRQELLGVKQSFVRIGYTLRKIDDQKLYEHDGYRSIAEFAAKEYGLGASIVSRFMAINREYSIAGYSEHLRPEYAELGRSQLEEMLKLPEQDRPMIQPETAREDIRELKKFNKQIPETGVADDLKQLIENFFHDNPDILNAIFERGEFEEQDMKQFAEIVNPGGNRSYKKGMYFLMLYETRIAVKRFGSAPDNMTWWEFYQAVIEIFGEATHGADTWKYYFEGGADQEEPDGAGADETIPGQMKYPADYEEGSWQKKETSEQVEEVAPAQKDTDESIQQEESVSAPEAREIAEEEPSAVQEETETVQAEPERKVPEPERPPEKVEQQPEKPERCREVARKGEESRTVKKGKSRIEYMKGLPAYELAHYLNDEFECESLTVDMLKSFGRLFEWLNQKMDERGKKA